MLVPILIGLAIVAGLISAVVVVRRIARMEKRMEDQKGEDDLIQHLLGGEMPYDENRWYVDPEGIVQVSRTHYESTGWRSGEAAKVPIAKFVENNEEGQRAYERAFATREPQWYLSRYDAPITFDGDRHRITKIVIIPDARGGLYCESRDITEIVAPLERRLSVKVEECGRLGSENKHLSQRLALEIKQRKARSRFDQSLPEDVRLELERLGSEADSDEVIGGVDVPSEHSVTETPNA